MKVAFEDGETLETLTQSSKMNKGELTGFLYDLCLKHGFHKPGWIDRLNETLDQVDRERERNNYEGLDGACDALGYGDNGYVCVWGRLNNTPNVRKIGLTESTMTEICEACNKTKQILEGIDEYESQIEALKTQVGKGVTVRIPSCLKGGRISDDGKKLYCNRTGEYRNVENHCKVLRRGANCKELRWTHIEARGKFGAPEK